MSATSHRRKIWERATRARAGRIRRALVGLTLVAATVIGGVAAPRESRPAAAGAGDACFVMRAYDVFLDRDATVGEITTWVNRFDSGTGRWKLPDELANSDEWLDVEITKIYRQALDRDPSSADLAYWSPRLRAGEPVTRIASLVFGAPEFHTRAGGTDAAFVSALYDRILHRTPSSGDLAFWVDQLSRRTAGSVAADFMYSRESRTDRVIVLYLVILGRVPDPSGQAYWVDQLARVNDVRLAASLASSAEFFSRAQVGCTPPTLGDFVISGHGYGHGRGMGQYGALGYAIDHGWTATQILDHFYGGTTAGTASNATQRVYLVGSAGIDLTVTQASGNLRVPGYGGDVAAVSIRRLSASTFRVYRSSSASCSGPWTLVGETTSTDVAVTSSVGQGETASRMIRDCRTGRSYRGALRAVRASRPGADFVTVNQVDTESLLRGIVPLELHPTWAPVGGGRGAAALRAQAVAARSYVLAGDTRWGTWATTCDSVTCQVYGGYSAEDPRTDASVSTTTGVVRRTAGGAIARTEFSSSTGGWSAGGVFPAVADAGDAYASNPHRNWSVTFTAAQIAAAFPGRGTFLGFDTWVRNGHGDWGGRVVSVRLLFSGGASGGSLTRTGEQVRSALGLKSDWFTA